MKIGITFSAFDLLHAGHIKMLEDAKRQCDYLICAIQTDPTLDRPEKNKPIQSVVERYIQLKGCKYIDEIVSQIRNNKISQKGEKYSFCSQIINRILVEKNRSIQSIVEHCIPFKGCKYVDEIVPYATEQDLEDVLRSFKIDVRIIGDEYANKQFTGRDYCEEKGIDLYFNKREHRFSSSGLRKEVQEKENFKVK